MKNKAKTPSQKLKEMAAAKTESVEAGLNREIQEEINQNDIEDESNWVEVPADMERLIGEQMGRMEVGEHAWHTVNAAIESLERSEELRALMLLRTLRHFLAKSTGHEVPE